MNKYTVRFFNCAAPDDKMNGTTQDIEGETLSDALKQIKMCKCIYNVLNEKGEVYNFTTEKWQADV
jgi:hypothetical protein